MWAVAIAVFVLSFAIRLLEFTFHNDHYEFLALGEEILRGAIPGIDFFDSARPLQHYLSTAGLWLFGHQMLAEALICIALLPLRRSAWCSSSAWNSGWDFAGRAGPRRSWWRCCRACTGYPKIIAPALGLVALWRYIDRPSPWRLAITAAMTAVAFYLRFDHGVAVCSRGGRRTCCQTLARVASARRLPPCSTGLVVLLFCGPWVVFQTTMGGSLSSGPGSGRLGTCCRARMW